MKKCDAKSLAGTSIHKKTPSLPHNNMHGMVDTT